MAHLETKVRPPCAARLLLHRSRRISRVVEQAFSQLLVVFRPLSLGQPRLVDLAVIQYEVEGMLSYPLPELGALIEVDYQIIADQSPRIIKKRRRGEPIARCP